MLLLGTATGRSAATRAERTHLPQHDGVREVFARFLRLFDRAAGGHVDLDQRLRLLSVLLPRAGRVSMLATGSGAAERSAATQARRTHEALDRELAAGGQLQVRRLEVPLAAVLDLQTRPPNNSMRRPETSQNSHA